MRFDRRTGERTVAAEAVIDILAEGPHLWALVASTRNDAVVRDIRQADLRDLRVYFQGRPIALFATNDGPGVLTDAKLLLPAERGWSSQRLAGAVEQYASVSPLIGGSVFVGYNKGEWGGGLRRIDASTGTISIVRDDSDEVCGGRLNPECSPVVGVIADPTNPDCALVGTSLAHLAMKQGEVDQVCDEAITAVFADPVPIATDGAWSLPRGTWPFDNFIAADGGWVAVGQDRYARSRRGTVTMADVPALRAWAGLRISDPVGDLVFVEAACCWGSHDFVRSRVIAIPVLE